MNTMAYILEWFRPSRLVQDWAPVLLWMAGIFYFSSRRDPLGFLPSSRHGFDVGKLAHIGEYAGLAALLYHALSNSRGRDRERGRQGAEERRNHPRAKATSSVPSDPPNLPDLPVANNPSATTASAQRPVVSPSTALGTGPSTGSGQALSNRRSALVVHSLLVSFTIALAYAILDELHQELVPGRGFELADIGYDVAGMTAAVGLIWLWNHKSQARAARPRRLS